MIFITQKQDIPDECSSTAQSRSPVSVLRESYEILEKGEHYE